MADNKTKPTSVPVPEFLATVPERRADEARTLIPVYESISGEPATMWGPSIIGFGRQEYETATSGGDMPRLAFSPRKANLTFYFPEGFHHYGDQLERLGPHKRSVSCLYLTRLDRVDLDVLREMLQISYARDFEVLAKPTTVAEYVAQIPPAALEKFEELRELVRAVAPDAEEVFSYGVVGYVPTGRKRAYAFVSGWKDHVAVYPVPKEDELQAEVARYQRGKGTLWFALDVPLPEELLRRVFQALMEA